MSGDQLDLDDLLRLAEGGFTLKDSEVARIAAEVRRLRAQVDKAHHVLGVRAMQAIGVEPPE